MMKTQLYSDLQQKYLVGDRDFCGIWAFGAFGEFSSFSLSSRLLPFYTMRFTRVMSRPVGEYRVYTATETAAVIRAAELKTRFCSS